jgi:hypothetical protein
VVNQFPEVPRSIRSNEVWNMGAPPFPGFIREGWKNMNPQPRPFNKTSQLAENNPLSAHNQSMNNDQWTGFLLTADC